MNLSKGISQGMVTDSMVMDNTSENLFNKTIDPKPVLKGKNRTVSLVNPQTIQTNESYMT